MAVMQVLFRLPTREIPAKIVCEANSNSSGFITEIALGGGGLDGGSGGGGFIVGTGTPG